MFDVDSLTDSISQKVAERISRANATEIRPRLLTVGQAATYLGRSTRGIQHLISDRAIPAVRCDRRVFLDREDLDRWIDENKQ